VRRFFLPKLETGSGDTVAWVCRLRTSKRARRRRLLEPSRQSGWQKALQAADHLRDKFVHSISGLATPGMERWIRERTHENPTGLPGKSRADKKTGKRRVRFTASAAECCLSSGTVWG